MAEFIKFWLAKQMVEIGIGLGILSVVMVPVIVYYIFRNKRKR